MCLQQRLSIITISTWHLTTKTCQRGLALKSLEIVKVIKIEHLKNLHHSFGKLMENDSIRVEKTNEGSAEGTRADLQRVNKMATNV